MDLAQYDVVEAASKPRPLSLTLPNGKPTDVVLHVLGYDAPPVVEAVRACDRSGIGQKGTADFDFLSFQEDRKRVRVKAALVGWENLGIGEDVTEFSGEAVDALLDRDGLSWIVDQVETFGGDRANLFPEPQKA